MNLTMPVGAKRKPDYSSEFDKVVKKLKNYEDEVISFSLVEAESQPRRSQ